MTKELTKGDGVVKQDAEKTIIFDHAQICFGHLLEDLLKH